MQSKKCSKCKLIKSTLEFHKWSATKDGLHYECKFCRKRYYNNGSDDKRIAYNLSFENYGILYENQRGRCAICDSEPLDKSLSVDHNHRTGEVRGLLCSSCNIGLGYFKDNPTLLDKAKTYLEK